MARPQSATDEEILDAAMQVIARRGYDAFTLSEVAAEVGLSRAAIILRFKSTQALKLTLMTRMVEMFNESVKAFPTQPGGDSLIKIAALIGQMIPNPTKLAAFFTFYSGNIEDERLADLERERGYALRAAISRVMPKVVIDHESAVLAFMANLTGSMMHWQAHGENMDAGAYLVKQTKEWLRLAQIPFSEDAAGGSGKPEPQESRTPMRALQDAEG